MIKFLRLKSKHVHLAGVIYEVMCTPKKNYIRKTKRHVKIRWEEHSDINKIPGPSRTFKEQPKVCIYMECFNDWIY